MKKKIYMVGVVAALSISMIIPGTALAAGPLATKVNSGGYDEETWACLQDDILEYDEVPMLVHEYNSSIQDAWENLEDARQTLLKNVQELESQQRKLKDGKESAEKSGDVGTAYMYSEQKKYLDKTTKSIKSSTLKQLNSKSTLSSIQRGEDQIVKGAQALMISYDSLRKQRDILGHLAELYDAQYQLAVNKQAQGMATEAEVLAAQVNKLSAQSSIDSIDSGLLQMNPSLCTLTGWPADANPEIAAIPPVDVSKIDTFELETDAVKAIGNNTTLMELRRSKAGKTNDGAAARLAAIEEGEQKMVIEIQRLYNDVLAQKAAYESAQTGFDGAQKNMDGYERMYQLGLLSKSDYLGTQISYYQKKAAYETADMTLRQAIETYEWAIKGYADLE